MVKRPPSLPTPVAITSRWAMVWLLMALLAAALGHVNGLGRVENIMVDTMGAHSARAPLHDVVIVAIDDQSLARLGRWPWRRARHAQLIDRLSEAAPRVIGLDLLLSEPDRHHPEDDQALADAMRRSGRVVLPLHAQWVDGQGMSATPPSLPFWSAARAVGHIHVRLDADGVARSVYLSEGTAERSWPHWSLALMRAGGERWPAWAGGVAPALDESDDFEGAPRWRRDSSSLIPYAGPPGHFDRVSYIDVLEGRVPPERLRGKYVLIGATAAGLGDDYATPMAGPDSQMSGVELAANVLDGLRRGLHVREASPWENALFCLLPLLLVPLALYGLPPRWLVWAVLGLMLQTYALAWLARRYFGLQFAPLAALACLALVYPMWMRLRLQAVLRYLADAFTRLQHEAPLRTEPAAPATPPGDLLDRRMGAMAQAVEQLASLQRFVSDSLDSLSDVVLAVDAQGRILLANRAAAAHFGQTIDRLQGQHLDDCLAGRLRWPSQALLPDLQPLWSGPAVQWHVVDAQQRDWLLKSAPRHRPSGQRSGSLVSLVDISSVQRAQRQRDEALRFISHDMRAPQSSILTLLELRRLDPGHDHEVLDRIEAHARRTLSLADDFVHLARAQSEAVASEPVDLAEVLVEAVDQFWEQAQAREVRLDTRVPAEPCWCLGDRELLTRAIGNLIDNALKYGPAGARVDCRLARAGGLHVITVSDQGPGVPPQEWPTLFDPFKRLDPQAPARGAGLGLSLVQAVVLRHGGRVQVGRAEDEDGDPVQGARFRITLPAECEPHARTTD